MKAAKVNHKCKNAQYFLKQVDYDGPVQYRMTHHTLVCVLK